MTLAGIGWRAPHHGAVLERRPALGFLEVHAENHMGGGRRAAVLEQARRDYPISIDVESVRKTAYSQEARAYERYLPSHWNEYTILRVDRAELSIAAHSAS